jgi:hypothetical protein
MKKWTFITIIAALLVATTNLAQGKGYVTVAGLGNDETLKLFVGFGEPNEGCIGPVVGWHEGVDHALWQVGVRAELDVSGRAQAVVDKLDIVPDSWWGLLRDLEARVLLTAEVGAVDVAHGGRAWAAPGVKLALGPISYSVAYEIFEGGRARDISASGVTHFLGVEKRF